MKKVAVILSGCGFKDGAEITEAVSSLISLSKEGASYQCFAPSVVVPVTNYLTDQQDGTQNLLEESARIARGDIKDVRDLKSDDFDALLFPGGFGAARFLCNWAEKGSQCTVNEDVARAITAFYKEEKPIGAICIAPVLLAKVLGKQKITVTIGNDKETALEVEKTGATHEDCPVDDYISERNHKILTTPAYMYEATPFEAFTGISKMIKELVEMA